MFPLVNNLIVFCSQCIVSSAKSGDDSQCIQCFPLWHWLVVRWLLTLKSLQSADKTSVAVQFAIELNYSGQFSCITKEIIRLQWQHLRSTPPPINKSLNLKCNTSFWMFKSILPSHGVCQYNHVSTFWKTEVGIIFIVLIRMNTFTIIMIHLRQLLTDDISFMSKSLSVSLTGKTKYIKTTNCGLSPYTIWICVTTGIVVNNLQLARRMFVTYIAVHCRTLTNMFWIETVSSPNVFQSLTEKNYCPSL